LNIVGVHHPVARHIAQQPIKVVHGRLAIWQEDVQLVVAIHQRRVGVSADPAGIKVDLDRVVDDIQDRRILERDLGLARRITVKVVLVQPDRLVRREVGVFVDRVDERLERAPGLIESQVEVTRSTGSLKVTSIEETGVFRGLGTTDAIEVNARGLTMVVSASAVPAVSSVLPTLSVATL
jgi:hypothetical protein